MFLFNGTIYGANVHLQQDPSECDPIRPSPDGLGVWQSHGPILVAGSGSLAGSPSLSGSRSMEAPRPRPSGTIRPSTEAPPADETPEEELARLKDERSDHLTYLSALLGGLVIGLWLEGK